MVCHARANARLQQYQHTHTVGQLHDSSTKTYHTRPKVLHKLDSQLAMATIAATERTARREVQCVILRHGNPALLKAACLLFPLASAASRRCVADHDLCHVATRTRCIQHTWLVTAYLSHLVLLHHIGI